MTTIVKEPIQVYLPTEQVDALHALAEERGVTLDEVIEQMVEVSLAGTLHGELPNQAVSGERDPLWDIIGIGESDVTDLSENHDKYLIEAEEAHNHSWPGRSS